MGISFEKARADFHKGEWDSDDDSQQWEPDMAKVRGLILKWLREQDEVRGHAEELEGHVVNVKVDNWIRDKLGEGANAVIRTGDYSKAGFERVTKNDIAKQIDILLENNDEFAEMADEKWVDIAPDNPDDSPDEPAGDYLAGGNTMYVANDLIDMDSGGVCDGDVATPEPRARRYKYFIKRYVMETREIAADSDKPNAEGLAKAWVRWLKSELDTTDRYLVHADGTEPAPGMHEVDREDIAEWCRELWEDDEEFVKYVRMKWNREERNGDDKAPGEPELTPIDRPDMNHEREKSGQTGINDW